MEHFLYKKKAKHSSIRKAYSFGVKRVNDNKNPKCMEIVNDNSLCTVSSDTRTGSKNKRSQIQNRQKEGAVVWFGVWGLFWFGFVGVLFSFKMY